ncbi:MAG: MauE/DoxX family redox-associated membrane protein, partial [Geminicoccales bacterium]
MTLVLAAQLVLAAVFLAAALPKLHDRSGFHRAVVGFGVPPWAAGPASLLIPGAELAVGLGLLGAGLAWWAALGGVSLLGLFTIGIIVNLARGLAPDCQCFGQLRSRSVGWGTVARNGGLTGLAGLIVAFGPGPSPVRWLAGLSTVEVLEGAALVVGVLGLGTALLIGQRRRLPDRSRTGPPAVARAPAFEAPDLDGGRVTLAG